MRSLFLFFLTLVCATHLSAQKSSVFRNYLEGFVRDTADVSKPQILVYPTIGYSPETRTEIGFSGLLLYYNNQNPSNRLSEITARTFYTVERQYGAFLEHALYSDRDEWFFLGNIRYQSFPLSFFGVGIRAKLSDEQIVESTQFVVKERILKKVRENFYVGPEFEYNRTSKVDFANPQIINGSPEITGTNGSTNLSIGLGLVLDSRHNVLNVRDGYFAELAFLRSASSLGSDLDFSTMISDNRFFKSFRPDQVLAVQVISHISWGEVPFNQLPQLGGPNLLRGYYLGRFRDRGLMATQLEYRFLPIPFNFTKRIGAAIFASSGTVFGDRQDLRLRNFKGAAGAGLRFLLFPKKDVYVRMDYALTQEGNALYIYIGEAF